MSRHSVWQHVLKSQLGLLCYAFSVVNPLAFPANNLTPHTYNLSPKPSFFGAPKKKKNSTQHKGGPVKDANMSRGGSSAHCKQ